jgi:hypothetical protein
MRTLPTTPLSLFQTVKAIIVAYPKIFAQTFLLVVVSSLWHWVVPPLYLVNPAYAAVAFVGAVLLTWFLYTAVIARANLALMGGRMDLHSALRVAKKRFLYVLGSNLIFFAIGLLLALTIFELNLIFDLTKLHPMYLLLSVAIVLSLFVYFYFAIPEIALENAYVLAGFERSVRLVRYYWWRTFIVLGLTVAVILGFEALGILITGKSRIMLFTTYHFLLQVFFYPLIVSTTLILLNDLKLRQEQ